MDNHPHQEVYKAKYLPATNTKGSRVKIINVNTGVTKIEPYRYEFDDLREFATYYIEQMYTTLLVMNFYSDKDILYLICY